MNNEITEITYWQYCIMDAGNNPIKAFLCGETWKQTQIKTGIFFIFIIVIILLLIYFFKRRKK